MTRDVPLPVSVSGPATTPAGTVTGWSAFSTSRHTSPARPHVRLPRRHPARGVARLLANLDLVCDVSGSTATSDVPGHRFFAFADIARLFGGRNRRLQVGVIGFDDVAYQFVPPTNARRAATQLEKLASRTMGGGTDFAPAARLLNRRPTPAGRSLTIWATDLGAPLPCPELEALAADRPCALLVLTSWTGLPEDPDRLPAALQEKGWPAMPAISLASFDDVEAFGLATADLVAATA